MLRKFVSTANTEDTKCLKGCESSDDHRRYAFKSVIIFSVLSLSQDSPLQSRNQAHPW